MVSIGLINESSMVSNDQAATMAAACQIQLDLHVLPAWRLRPVTIKFYADKTQVPGYAWLISVIDTPDVANALGYHNEQNDRPDGFVFCSPVLNNGGGIITSLNNITVSSVLSHECIELVGDRFCNEYCDNGSTSWALELCDPVQNNSYTINVNGTNVSVSDFCFESFFNPQAKSPDNMPFNYMKTLSAPFSLDKGGYAIIRTGGPGSESQIFGEQFPEWLKTLKKNEFSRTFRRI